MSKWTETSKSNPCPACNGDHWCGWSPDGQRLRCMRPGEAPSGMHKISHDGEGTIYGFDDWKPKATTKRERPSTNHTNAKRLHAEAIARMTPERLALLAESLGIPADAVEWLCPGWCDAESLREMGASGAGWPDRYPEGAFAFPEVDGEGRLAGLSLRATDGRKGSPSSTKTGLRRAITVPEGVDVAGTLVLVVEGASDAAAGMAMGLPVVSRPSNRGGAEHLADLLRDAVDVVILGENDEKPDGKWPGREGSEAVARTLAERWGKPVRWCMPPEDAKDLRDLFAKRGVDGGEEMLERIENESETVSPQTRPDALVAASPATPEAPTLPPQAPYPTDVFPPAIADYIRETARVLHVDESSIGSLALPILASTIGNEREIAVRRDWTEPSILWGAIVARSGSAKTPMLRAAMRGLLEVERGLDKGNADRREKYERERQEWKDTPKDERGAEPARPREDRIVASDATIEKIAQMLGENPRGLLVEVDELAGLIAGFDSYKKAGGGDREKWLTLYNAGTLRVDRKTSASVKIDRASVSIVGGIQPSRLREVFSDSMVGSGLAARFLFAMPESRPKVNTGEEIPLAVEEEFVQTFAKLWRLRAPQLESRPGPFTISLSRQARGRFLEWSNAHNHEGEGLPEGGALEAWSKLEAIPLRTALILHTLDWPAGFECSLDTLDRAIALTEWHKTETLRVYDWLAGARAETEDPVVAFIREKHNGDASVRDLRRAGPLRASPKEEAKARLASLEAEGKGRLYFDGSSERFRLN